MKCCSFDISSNHVSHFLSFSFMIEYYICQEYESLLDSTFQPCELPWEFFCHNCHLYISSSKNVHHFYFCLKLIVTPPQAANLYLFLAKPVLKRCQAPVGLLQPPATFYLFGTRLEFWANLSLSTVLCIAQCATVLGWRIFCSLLFLIWSSGWRPMCHCNLSSIGTSALVLIEERLWNAKHLTDFWIDFLFPAAAF